jgi:ADP-ribose pyrophosphatase YjhB (NUDIX family)
MKIIFGDRIARQGKIRIGWSAVIFDDTREKVLLTRRADNGQWCLPGGGMEAGESASEACLREVKEETGLDVEIKRLVGVYSNPNFLGEYADGKKIHIVTMNFEAIRTNGVLTLNDEVTEFGYFSAPEIASLDLIHHHIERIEDAFRVQPEAYIR